MANDDEAEFLASYDTHDYDVPLTTVDVVNFALIDEQLCVQLLHREQHPFLGYWALPGGFVDVEKDADLEATARRILTTKTATVTPYLEQLGGFGDNVRDPRGWSATFVYFALVDITSLAATPAQGRWWPIAGEAVEPELAFDHARVLAAATERLRNKVSYSSLPVHLLPEQFTLSQCQRVFEIVLGHSLEKSAFRRRLRDAEVVEQIPNAFERGSNRPAALYRLRAGKKTVFFPGTLRGGQGKSR